MPFDGLDPRVRNEVARLAARRILHPDPMVAASSVEWAYGVLTRRTRVRTLGRLGLSAAINLVAFGSLPDGDGLVGLWRRRRLGKRIVTAAERAGFRQATWALMPTARGPKIRVADLAAGAGRVHKASDGRARARHDRRAVPRARRRGDESGRAG